METKEFNPTKEEFESVFEFCYTIQAVLFYYGITHKQLNEYLWRNYKLRSYDFVNVYRAKHKKNNNGAYIVREEFENLLSLGYGVNEVADYFMTTPSKIEQWCKVNYGCEVKKVGKSLLMRTRVLLRRHQLGNVENGNAQVQVWMGKQLDEQKDTDKLILQKETKETDIEATPDVFDKIASALSKEE